MCVVAVGQEVEWQLSAVEQEAVGIAASVGEEGLQVGLRSPPDEWAAVVAGDVVGPTRRFLGGLGLMLPVIAFAPRKPDVSDLDSRVECEHGISDSTEQFGHLCVPVY